MARQILFSTTVFILTRSLPQLQRKPFDNIRRNIEQILAIFSCFFFYFLVSVIIILKFIQKPCKIDQKVQKRSKKESAKQRRMVQKKKEQFKNKILGDVNNQYNQNWISVFTYQQTLEYNKQIARKRTTPTQNKLTIALTQHHICVIYPSLTPVIMFQSNIFVSPRNGSRSIYQFSSNHKEKFVSTVSQKFKNEIRRRHKDKLISDIRVKLYDEEDEPINECQQPLGVMQLWTQYMQAVSQSKVYNPQKMSKTTCSSSQSNISHSNSCENNLSSRQHKNIASIPLLILKYLTHIQIQNLEDVEQTINNILNPNQLANIIFATKCIQIYGIDTTLFLSKIVKQIQNQCEMKSHQLQLFQLQKNEQIEQLWMANVLPFSIGCMIHKLKNTEKWHDKNYMHMHMLTYRLARHQIYLTYISYYISKMRNKGSICLTHVQVFSQGFAMYWDGLCSGGYFDHIDIGNNHAQSVCNVYKMQQNIINFSMLAKMASQLLGFRHQIKFIKQLIKTVSFVLISETVKLNRNRSNKLILNNMTFGVQKLVACSDSYHPACQQTFKLIKQSIDVPEIQQHIILHPLFAQFVLIGLNSNSGPCLKLSLQIVEKIVCSTCMCPKQKGRIPMFQLSQIDIGMLLQTLYSTYLKIGQQDQSMLHSIIVLLYNICFQQFGNVSQTNQLRIFLEQKIDYKKMYEKCYGRNIFEFCEFCLVVLSNFGSEATFAKIFINRPKQSSGEPGLVQAQGIQLWRVICEDVLECFGVKVRVFMNDLLESLRYALDKQILLYQIMQKTQKIVNKLESVDWKNLSKEKQQILLQYQQFLSQCRQKIQQKQTYQRQIRIRN